MTTFTTLRRLLLLLPALLLGTLAARAQTGGGVGIGTTAPDASAALDIVSSSKGALLPRLTQAQRTAIASPAAGLIVFQTDGTPGFYYYGGGSWQQLATAAGAAVTASNGLTKTGSNIALGGSLSSPTTIIQGGNAFSLTGGNVGIGTAVPQATLEASGDFRVSNGATNAVLGTTGSGNNRAFNNPGLCQSFTLPVPATITSIRLRSSVTYSTTFTLYSGGGNGGPALAPAQAINFVADVATTVPLTTPLALPAGTYTLGLADVNNIYYFNNGVDNYPDGKLYFGTNASGGTIDYEFAVAYTSGTATSSFYVAPGGNVGIGTTGTPGARLDVTGGSIRLNTAGQGLVFPDGTVQKTKPVLSISGQSLTINGPDGNTVTLPTNTGPAGPTGATGATGPAGPAGTNASVTASNGLSVAGGNVTLGGTALSAATDVPLAGNNLTFSGTGNVGIGINQPSAKLHLYGGTGDLMFGLGGLTKASSISVTDDGGFGGGLSFNVHATTGSDNWPTGTSTALTILPNANVGIGTTAPAQLLDVTGGSIQISTAGQGLVFPDGTTQTTAAAPANLTGDVTSTGAATTYNTLVPASKGGAGTVSGLLKADGSGTVSAAVAGTDYAAATGSAAYVQNGTAQQAGSNFNISGNGTIGGNSTVSGNSYVSGNVGIGTTAPATRLQVVSTDNAPATNILDVQAQNQTVGAALWYNGLRSTGSNVNTTLCLDAKGTGSLLLNTQTGTGNVGIGTTAPSALLDVAGSTRLRGLPTAGLVTTDASGNLSSVAQPATAAALTAVDDRQVSPADHPAQRVTAGFGTYANATGTTPFADFLHLRSYVDESGGNDNLLVFNKSDLGMRLYQQAYGSTTTYSTYKDVLLADNGTTAGYLPRYTSGGNTVSVGQSAVFQDGSGNVGIGLTNPDATLDIARGAGSLNSLIIRGTARNSVFNLGTAEDIYIQGGKTTSNVYINDGGGNVGIGTTAPTQRLDVRGNVRLGDDGGRDAPGTGQAIEWVGPGVNTDPVGLYRVNPASDQSELRVVVGDNADPNDKFVVGLTSGSTEGGIPGGTFTPNFTVTSAGNVGVGISAPAYKLDVAGDINASGQVRANGVVLTSDRRFKQDIRPLTGALAAVLALRGVRYQWNALGQQHGGQAGAEQVGLIAQEVEALYPELVSTGPDGYKAVNYAQLTPVLIEALKEQQRQLEALKAQHAALQARTAQADADHASLLTLQAQVARLLGEGAQAQK